MKEYVNPHINFKKIEICERIANTCWGEHKNGDIFDFKYGSNIYTIKLMDSNCGKNNIEVTLVGSNVPVNLLEILGLNNYSCINISNQSS